MTLSGTSSRGARRAAVAGGDDSTDHALAYPSDATLAAAEAVYADRKSARKPPRKTASAPPWVAAADTLGDMWIILKLAAAHITPPGLRFLLDAADAFEAAQSMVRQHFDESRLPVGLAGAEIRSEVKPKTAGREDFQAALARTEIPDAFKGRWSVEWTMNALCVARQRAAGTRAGLSACFKAYQIVDADKGFKIIADEPGVLLGGSYAKLLRDFLTSSCGATWGGRSGPCTLPICTPRTKRASSRRTRRTAPEAGGCHGSKPTGSTSAAYALRRAAFEAEDEGQHSEIRRGCRSGFH